MAIVTAYQPFNQPAEMAIDYVNDLNSPISYDATGNTVTRATWQAISGDYQTLVGNVNYSGDYFTSTGTLTGYIEQDATGALEYSIGNGSFSFQDYLAYTNNADATGLQAAVFNAADTFIGSTGADTMLSYGGDDIIYGGGQLIATVDGNDQLYGGAGNDQLFGNAGNDYILGGDHYLDATDGADSLYGGLGDDTIIGTGGNDYLVGGTGDDVFVFNGSHGYDTIADFTQGDVLSIQGSSYTVLSTDGYHTALQFDNGAGALMLWTTPDELDASDFYFWG
ncbi:MAG: hypothetical protein CL607_23805 [Anaerolineaceae bacterium]|nr:hypothetical protein [Anaerolineaceae bacterium]